MPLIIRLSCSDCAAASGVYTLFETEDSHGISRSIDGSAAQFAADTRLCLAVELPEQKPCDHAIALKIAL